MQASRHIAELRRKRVQLESEEALIRANQMRLRLKEEAYLARKEAELARRRNMRDLKDAQVSWMTE